MLVRREFSENRRDGDAYRLCKAQRRAKREATQVANAVMNGIDSHILTTVISD